MDKQEAKAILAIELEEYRNKSYKELVESLGCYGTVERQGKSSQTYQVQVESFWDDKPNENLRVSASIDDGGIRTFSPMSDSFIISPNGEYIGE